MLNYSNNVVFLIKKDPDSYIDSFKTKVQSRLKAIECRTEIQGNTVTFDRIVRYFPSANPGRNEILKLLREGRIEIDKIDSRKINIKWEVKLDTLYFISSWIGILAGFVFGFGNSSLLIFVVGGTFFSLIPYCIGYYLVKTQIDELVFTSM